MGRYISPNIAQSVNLTKPFDDANSVYDANGFLTSYIANDIQYTNITWADEEGVASQYGGIYKVVTGYTEKNLLTNEEQTITVNYDAVTGRVSSLTIT